jgi:hypothetical protein
MSIKVSRDASGRNLQYADVHALGVRDGKVFLDQTLDHYESFGHKAKRFARKAVPWLLIALLAGSAAHSVQAHELPHYLPAATVITNAGQAIVTNRMTGAGTEPKFVMWGTGAGTAAVTDTTLFTETTDEARTTGTSSRVTTTVTNDTYQVVGTITVATAGKTITNVGLFDVVTASSGNLYFKSDFTGLALLVGDSITFTIKIKFA